MNARLLAFALGSAGLVGLSAPRVAYAKDAKAAAEVANADSATESEASPQAPLISVYDTGDHAAIVVRGAVADVESVRWRWGKMHVPIDVGPRRIHAQSFNDATVKRVALIGGESPRVLILFRHGDKIAKKLTEAAEIEAVQGGFRVLVPRKSTLFPPPPPPVAVAPDPSPVPALATTVTASGAPAAVQAVPTQEEASVPEASASDASTPLPVLTGLPAAGAAQPEAADGIATASAQSSQAAWMGIMTSLLLLAACGGVVWWSKRRRGLAVAGTRFEVLGNQALGGKSRLVLLGLGGRRMLLAVSDAGASLVDKWTEGDLVAPQDDAPVALRAHAGTPTVDPKAASPLSALEFDAPTGKMQISREPEWLGLLRGEPETPSATDLQDQGDELDAESSAVAGLLELRSRGRVGRGKPTAPLTSKDPQPDDEDRWVAALAAQLRAGGS